MSLFSYLHATKGRSEKAAATMKDWHDKMVCPVLAEWIFVGETWTDIPVADPLKFKRTHWKIAPLNGSAPAWDAAYHECEGGLLVQVSDDFECPPLLDYELLMRLVPKYGHKWMNVPLVIRVSDGHRKDGLMTMAVCTRAYAQMQGEFLHGGYSSVFSDDDFSYRAAKNARDGKCEIIDATDLVFNHRHHYHDKSIPWDETYAHQNRPEAYEAGRKLFFERNPEARTDGLRTWA